METNHDNEKIRENRLRRAARRQGMMLMKVRRRDPDAVDYGRYWLIDPSTNCVVSGFDGYNNTGSLDDVEEWLRPGDAA